MDKPSYNALIKDVMNTVTLLPRGNNDLFGLTPTDYTKWSSQSSSAGRSFTADDVDRAKNKMLYGRYLTDKEMVIQELRQTPVGKILYG